MHQGGMVFFLATWGGVKRKWEGLIWSFFKKGLGGTFQGIESILNYLGGGWICDGLGAKEI